MTEQQPQDAPAAPAPPPLPLSYATPVVGPDADMSAAEQYALVPWYRRSGFVSLLVIFGLCIGLTLIPACILVLTGPVYYPKVGPDGRLRTWSVLNKVVAVILLVLWTWVFLSQILQLFGIQIG